MYSHTPVLGVLRDSEQLSTNGQEADIISQNEKASVRRMNPKLLPKVKEKHFDENGKHNDAFDHQVFLGERSAEFANLTEEEAGLRLGLIFDQIDEDNSTDMSGVELTKWIKAVAKERVDVRVDEFWGRCNPSGNNTTLFIISSCANI